RQRQLGRRSWPRRKPDHLFIELRIPLSLGALFWFQIDSKGRPSRQWRVEEMYREVAANSTVREPAEISIHVGRSPSRWLRLDGSRFVGDQFVGVIREVEGNCTQQYWKTKTHSGGDDDGKVVPIGQAIKPDTFARTDNPIWFVYRVCQKVFHNGFWK